MTKWYVIEDLENFVQNTRAIVYQNFASSNEQDEEAEDAILNELNETEQKELDSVLSYNESIIITKNFAKKQQNRKSKKFRYIISDEIFMDIVTSMNSRMISNILQGLVSKGLVESAYDNEANDFIFWVKTNENKEHPETD